MGTKVRYTGTMTLTQEEVGRISEHVIFIGNDSRQVTKDEELFLQYVGKHYNQIEDKLKMLCGKNKQRYSQDAYHEVIIRCHKAIERKGKLNDTSPYGIESYIIRSYFNYLIEDKRAAVNAKRDLNYNSDNITELHEKWTNENKSSSRDKLVSDLFKDYSVLYLMAIVEANFDSEHFYLFRVKELTPGMTYKKLQQQTHIKGVRQKVVDVKKFLKENVSQDDIRKSFYEVYGDLI